ncbi:MAG: hydroxymethylglutaryl-CoA lyase [Leptospiraceae bacterium]|nr:hydroxymethylglutaryl-CoA lyase [Leptospiraceae bacterium]
MRELKICEVAPRDGLQSLGRVLSVEERVDFVSRLYRAGLFKIEVGALVNPKLVPAMAGSDEVFTKLSALFPENQKNFSLLVPNAKGLEKAFAIGCQSVAFFTATSETFNQKNINRTVAESIAELGPLIAAAREKGMLVRLYVSTVFDCAYEGTKNPEKELAIFSELFDSVDEISLGDTTGRGTPQQVATLIAHGILDRWRDKIWWHFHDTYGHAADNVRVAMREGFTQFDSSAGGIGGCPFSPGAKGNIATEKVLSLAREAGLAHNIRLEGVRLL